MPTSLVSGVQLYWEVDGVDGSPLVFVHGSWVDSHHWDAVRPLLARRFRILTYDRRGHGRSERPAEQGSVQQDVEDLAALMTELGFSPAHVVGNSFGASIALRLAGSRPRLLRSVMGHEPPLFGLLEGVPEVAANLAEFRRRLAAVVQRLEAGQAEAAAAEFVDTIALGPGGWAQLPPPVRATFVANAPTFLDEVADPEMLTLAPSTLTTFPHPVLLSEGDQSPPLFAAVLAQLAAVLPRRQRHTFPGAGHNPHLTHPEQYAAAIAAFAEEN